jgi:hypothetical protein
MCLLNRIPLNDSGRRCARGLAFGTPSQTRARNRGLLDLSELSDLLGARPVRSHLVHALVQLDRDHAIAGPR